MLTYLASKRLPPQSKEKIVKKPRIIDLTKKTTIDRDQPEKLRAIHQVPGIINHGNYNGKSVQYLTDTKGQVVGFLR